VKVAVRMQVRKAGFAKKRIRRRIERFNAHLIFRMPARRRWRVNMNRLAT
jgi:hypothetical protein